MEVSKTPNSPPVSVPESPKNESPISEIDWKVYKYVVLGYLLIGIGILLGFSAFYSATVIHPILAFAAPAFPIISGILCLKKIADFQRRVFTNFVENSPPLGIGNKSANCWINASLQLFCNIPAYAQIIENLKAKWDESDTSSKQEDYKKISALLDAYSKYQREKTDPPHLIQVSSVDTHLLRQWLHDSTSKNIINGPITDRDGSEHEDAIEFFKHLLYLGEYHLGEIKRITTRNYSHKEPDKSERKITDLNYLMLGLQKYANDSSVDFSELLENSFQDEFESDGVKYTISDCFETPPSDLTLHLYRLNPVDLCGNVATKICTNVNCPIILNAPEERFGGPAKYHLDGFVIHEGNSKKGHYIAYVYTNSTWYIIDDTMVDEAEVDEVEQQVQKASILHYTKMENDS